MSRPVVPLVAAALLLAPGAASAQDAAADPPSGLARVQTYFRFGTSWVTDPSFDLVSEDNTFSRVELGLGYIPRLLDDDLLLQLGWRGSWSEAILFGVADSHLQLHSILGSASYTFSRHWVARAFVSAGAELAFATLSIEEFSRSSQTTALLGLQGLLGYEVFIAVDSTRGQRGPGLSFSVETGYEFFPSPARFDDLRHRDSADAKPPPLRSAGIDVGEMKLSGWILRYSIALRL